MSSARPERASPRCAPHAAYEAARTTQALALALLAACSHPTDGGVPGENPVAPLAAKPAAESAAKSAAKAAAPRSVEPPPAVQQAAPADPTPLPGCRVTSASGAVSRAGVPVRVGDRWNDREPVDLGADARLQLIHTATTRQWTVTGPARLVACAGGEEELILARGRVRTEPGAGIRPGAEVWIGTPYGSVRYAEARAELLVGEKVLETRVSSGPLWFTSLAGSSADESSKERSLSAAELSLPAKPHRLRPDVATARCGQAAALAEQRARALLAPSSEPLGARAAEHVRARQRAHAICSSAFATLLDDSTLAGEGDRGLFLEEGGFEEVWRRVPGGG